MAGTPLHFAMLAFSAFLIVAVVIADQHWRFRRALAVVVLVFWVVMQTWLFLPERFDPYVSWPLHVCDLANLIGPAALLFRWRWARTLIVFWGIGLTTQGFITPVLEEGPGEPMFWFFWFNHTFVLTVAIDELVVGGYRPTRRDMATLIGLTAVYVAVIFVIDVVTGWNYAFVGRDQSEVQQTIVHLLGPWPLRVIWMCVIVATGFLLMGWGFSKLPGGERGLERAPAA